MKKDGEVLHGLLQAIKQIVTIRLAIDTHKSVSLGYEVNQPCFSLRIFRLTLHFILLFLDLV